MANAAFFTYISFALYAFEKAQIFNFGKIPTVKALFFHFNFNFKTSLYPKNLISFSDILLASFMCCILSRMPSSSFSSINENFFHSSLLFGENLCKSHISAIYPNISLLEMPLQSISITRR